MATMPFSMKNQRQFSNQRMSLFLVVYRASLDGTVTLGTRKRIIKIINARGINELVEKHVEDPIELTNEFKKLAREAHLSQKMFVKVARLHVLRRNDRPTACIHSANKRDSKGRFQSKGPLHLEFQLLPS